MNSRFTVFETSLNRAEFRWKWLRILRHSSLLGIGLCLAAIGLEYSIISGRLTNKSAALTVLVVLGALGSLAWLFIVISVLVRSPERRWLAAAVERIDRRFLDRLNTLLFLET